MQVLQSFLWVSPIHDTFSVAHVFCVKFLGKNYVLFARLISMPNQKENSCLHFQKRCVSMILLLDNIFAQIKYDCYLGHEKE